jgi:hypothetical protein
VSINFGTYRILYQTECTKRENRLRRDELWRRIVNDRSDDMKRISQNLGRFVDFREIADISRRDNLTG